MPLRVLAAALLVLATVGAGSPHVGPKTAATIPTPAPPAPSSSGLVGEWTLISDDSLPPNLAVPDERMSFTADGKWKLARETDPQEGRYKVQDDVVVLISEIGGNTKVLRRSFKLEADELQLSNKAIGYSHYKRSK
jgi:hypothetical protein